MSSLPPDLRSETDDNVRLQALMESVRDPQAKDLLRINLNDDAWNSDWNFILTMRPEIASDYLKASCEGVENLHETFRLLLANTNIYEAYHGHGR